MVDYAKMLRPIFVIAFIVIIYIIIFMALRIMYKDVKNGDRKKILRKSLGLEIVSVNENSNLKKGTIIPINRIITIGRKEDNSLIINDPYASGHHAKVYVKNTDYFVEDLGSTNGTLLNDGKVQGKLIIQPSDEIRIGSTVFRVIG